MIYRALDEKKAIVLEGRLVLTSIRDPSRSDAYNVEESGTYDVLGRPKADPPQATGSR